MVASVAASGTEPGDFVEFDLEAIEDQRQRQIGVSLVRAARLLSEESGKELRVAMIDGEQVLADESGVRYRADVTRSGRLEVTAVLTEDLL
jgi:hypothetical protein